MSTSIAALEAEVLKLSPDDRAALLERIVASLPIDPAVEDEWDKEADRREQQLEDGSAQLIPGDEVIARLRAKLG